VNITVHNCISTQHSTEQLSESSLLFSRQSPLLKTAVYCRGGGKYVNNNGKCDRTIWAENGERLPNSRKDMKKKDSLHTEVYKDKQTMN